MKPSTCGHTKSTYLTRDADSPPSSVHITEDIFLSISLYLIAEAEEIEVPSLNGDNVYTGMYFYLRRCVDN